MERTLVSNPEIAAMLVELFCARFDPELARPRRRRSALETQIERSGRRGRQPRRGPDPAPLLGGDRRDAAHQLLHGRRRGRPLPYLSFKLDSTRLTLLPLPRPRFEIFVYSPRIEGVHLRGGRVARGGMRWSDRREDFRTEVLGPDEGPDGQERPDRAGRLQGRIRRQAPARRRRPRGALQARRSLATGRSCAGCST